MRTGGAGPAREVPVSRNQVPKGVGGVARPVVFWTRAEGASLFLPLGVVMPEAFKEPLGLALVKITAVKGHTDRSNAIVHP